MKTLAENIISHPNETKYHRFKPTNTKIQQYLINPKGPIIEYLRKVQRFTYTSHILIGLMTDLIDRWVLNQR